MEKYLKMLIDKLELENFRLQNTNDRLRREADRLKRENKKLRNAVTELAGDKLTACKLLGEGTRESEGSAVDN
jgi:FtsZ-binding cell division protein ZapB